MYMHFKQSDGMIVLAASDESADVNFPEADEYCATVEDQEVEGKVVDIGSLVIDPETGQPTPESVSVVNRTYLALTTDATDTADPINGIPDIPADGTSSCTISIQKKNGADDSDMTGAEDNETVDLETSRGKLSSLRVQLANGAAQVTLTSVPETCVTGVTAKADGLTQGSIQIQFAP